jgi:hypothetical protein
MKRFLFIILLVAAFFLFPWWVVFILGIIGSLLFNNFFEIILLGIMYDVYFHIPGLPWYKSIMYILMSIGIFFVVMIIKKLVRKPTLHINTI